MKKRLLKAITALILSISVFLPAGDLPLSVSYSAYAAESKSVAAPAASRESGTIYCMSNSTTVKLSSPNSRAEIYYSLNGGEYKKYSSAIKLTKNATIKAYAKLGGSKSSVVTYKYKLTPSINFNVADTSGGKLVKLTTGVSKVKFYYTTDGSTPTTKSKLYTSSGIKVTENCTLRVLAVRSGWTKGYYSNDITAVSKINTDQLGDGNFLTPYMSGSANVRFNGKYLEAKAKYWRCVDDNKKYYDTVSVTISEGKSVEFNIAQDHKFNTGDTVKSWQTGMGVSDVVLVGFDLNGAEYNLTSGDSDYKYFDKAELKAVSIDYTGKSPSVLYFYVLAHDNKGNKTAIEGITKVLINDSMNVTLSGSNSSGNSGNTATDKPDTTEQLGEGNFLTPSISGNANIRYNGKYIETKAGHSGFTNGSGSKFDGISITLSDGKSINFYIAQDQKFNTGDSIRSWKTTGAGVSNFSLYKFDLAKTLIQSKSDSKYIDKAELKAVSIDYTGNKPSVLYFYILAHDDKGNKTAVEGITKVYIESTCKDAAGNSTNNGTGTGNETGAGTGTGTGNGTGTGTSTGNGSTGGAYTSLDGKYSADLGEGKVNVDGKLYTGKAYNNNTSGYDRFDIDFDNNKKYVRIAMIENCVVEGKTNDIKSYRQSKGIAGKGLAGIWVGFGGLGFYTNPDNDSVTSNEGDYVKTIFKEITTTYETYRNGVVTIRFHIEYLSYSGNETHTIDGYCAIPYAESGEDYCSICTGTGKCQTCMGTTLGSNCPSCHGTKKCKYCEGKGSTPSLNEFSCPNCIGSGKCRACGGDGVNYDPFSKEITQCRKCSGTGICLWCDGSGFIS